MGQVWKNSKDRHPNQMPEPFQLTSLDAEEQQLYWNLLPDDGALHLISNGIFALQGSVRPQSAWPYLLFIIGCVCFEPGAALMRAGIKILKRCNSYFALFLTQQWKTLNSNKKYQKLYWTVQQYGIDNKRTVT